MSRSIFDDKIVTLARNRVGLNKAAFVDSGSLAGQDPSAQAAASAPPQGGGTSPMSPPAAMPPMGADPTAQALDPAGGGPNPLEARIAALEAGNAGGAKPGGSKGGGKGEQEIVLKQILNMLSIMMDAFGIPVPTQAMVPDSVAATAADPQGQAAQGAPQDASQGAAGPSSVLGQPPGPPQPVAPLTSVLGSPGAGAGSDAGAAPKSAAKVAAANWGGIAITPQMLHNASRPESGSSSRNGADARRILGLR